MSEDKALKQTRAALAPTLSATAAVLPLLAKAAQPRFSPEIVARWQQSCRDFATAWTERPRQGDVPLRRAVFSLCAIAVELGDADALALSEALASSTDLLEDPLRAHDPHLLAALAAVSTGHEEIRHPEQGSFATRARYYCQRLQDALKPRQGIRTATLDRLFVNEAGEHLLAMYETLDSLDPDATLISDAAAAIIALAEPLELRDLIDRSRILLARLHPGGGPAIDLDLADNRDAILDAIALVEAGIADIPLPDDDTPPAPIVF